MYTFAGAPWRTQQVVRQALLTLYRNQPGGMPGNDDGGVLSSWVVFAAIGIYPQISGVGGFVLSSPLFPRVTIPLKDGRTIQVLAPAASAGAPFVLGLKLNGSDYNRAWIAWESIANGGTLEFALGGSPNKSWGSGVGAVPPSYDVP